MGLQQPKVSHMEWRASQGFSLFRMDSLLSVSPDGVHVLSSGGGTVTQNVLLSYWLQLNFEVYFYTEQRLWLWGNSRSGVERVI